MNCEDMPVKKEDGADGLVLGGGGNMSFNNQVGDELVDFRDAHLAWVTFVVIDNELPDPIGVGFLGAAGVLFDPQGFAVLVEEFFALGRCLRCIHFLDFLGRGFYNSVHKLLSRDILHNTTFWPS